MLQLQPITRKLKDFKLFKSLYAEAFPRSERAPFAFLFHIAKKDTVMFNAYYDKDVFVGFTYAITIDDMAYLLYLAIKPEIRSKGYGAQILNYLQEQYPNNRIVLNIETEDENADNNADRIRRKNFYLKNGYSLTSIYFKMNGNIYDVLVSNGTCSIDDFRHLCKKYMGRFIFTIYRPKIWEKTIVRSL